jgi:hypothetical protein
MKGMLKHSKMIRKIASSKIAAGLTLLGLVSSCKNSGNGELVGSQPRNQWFDYDPFGTLFIPMGSYNIFCNGSIKNSLCSGFLHGSD